MGTVDRELDELIRRFRENMRRNSEMISSVANRSLSASVHKVAGRTPMAWTAELGWTPSNDELNYLSKWEDLINGHCLIEAVLKKDSQQFPFSAVVFFSKSSGFWRYGYRIPRSEPLEFCDPAIKYLSAASAKLAFRTHVLDQGFQIVEDAVLNIAARLQSAKTSREIQTGRRFGHDEDLT